MTTPKEIPLLLTPDNRAAVRAGIKTETRRTDKALDALANDDYFPALTPDNDWVFWSPGPVSEKDTAQAYPKGDNAGIKPRYGCPQKSPVRYWVKEPVRIRGLYEGVITSPMPWVELLYLDDGNDSVMQATEINENDAVTLLNRKDYRRPTTSMHMLKAFTRTWLRGKSVHPEKLGDITAEGAIAEGIELCPTVAANTRCQLIRTHYTNRRAWRDYLNGGYDLFPIQSYVSLWQSIHGPDPWNPQRWVWVVQFELEG